MNADVKKRRFGPKIFLGLVVVAMLTTYLFKRLQDDPTKYFKDFQDTFGQNNATFVSVCLDTFNSRKAGNMMFVLAALLYVSKHTGRVPIMPKTFSHGWIDHIFVNDLPRFPNEFVYNSDESIVVDDEMPGPVFNEKFKNLHQNNTLKQARIILICGYFQSYRYVADVEEELRRFLIFKEITTKSVNAFIAQETVSINDSNISLIGVHVRRTDFTFAVSLQNGLTVVDEKYINTSMTHVIKSFKPSRSLVAFMCSDDIDWVKKVVENLSFVTRYPNLKVVYSTGHDAAFDLCLLSKCNASIISTGTFSWWSGWLANGTTAVYYSLYPNRNTAYGANFIPEDYYPSTWKGFPELNGTIQHL